MDLIPVTQARLFVGHTMGIRTPAGDWYSGVLCQFNPAETVLETLYLQTPAGHIFLRQPAELWWIGLPRLSRQPRRPWLPSLKVGFYLFNWAIFVLMFVSLARDGSWAALPAGMLQAVFPLAIAKVWLESLSRLPEEVDREIRRELDSRVASLAARAAELNPARPAHPGPARRAVAAAPGTSRRL